MICGSIMHNRYESIPSPAWLVCGPTERGVSSKQGAWKTLPSIVKTIVRTARKHQSTNSTNPITVPNILKKVESNVTPSCKFRRDQTPRGKVKPQNGTPKGTLLRMNTSVIDMPANHDQKRPLDQSSNPSVNPRNLITDPARGSEKKGAGSCLTAERSAVTSAMRINAVPPCPSGPSGRNLPTMKPLGGNPCIMSRRR